MGAPAARLRELHRPGEPLLLANAWDAASARRFAKIGFAAIATTSGGVAHSLGFEDGQATPADEMLAAVARIVSAVEVPVTADMEAGYGLAADELADQLLATGAAGLNLEDSDHTAPGALVDAEAHARRIAVLAERGLVVNARIDVHLRAVGEPDGRLNEALRRAALYRDAGAACVFPILLDDEAELTQFVTRHDGPVNALLHAGSPPFGRLREIRIARVSVGSGIASAALDHAAAIAKALASGDDGPLRAARGGL